MTCGQWFAPGSLVGVLVSSLAELFRSASIREYHSSAEDKASKLRTQKHHCHVKPIKETVKRKAARLEAEVSELRRRLQEIETNGRQVDDDPRELVSVAFI